MRILVINLASIGDCIMRTPLTRALKKLYPGAAVDMLVTPVAREIAEMDASVRQVIVYDKRGAQRGLRGMIAVAALLRKNRYDLAICTNYALRGALIAWLAGAKRRCGYNEQCARWFLTDTIGRHQVMQYEAKNQLRVMETLTDCKYDWTTELSVDDETVAEADSIAAFRTVEGKKLVFCPLSNFENRSLDIDASRKLLAELKQIGTVFLIGSASQKKTLDEINGGNQAVVLAGKLSLKQLAALIRAADVMLSVDTGPMHMAVALHTPVVGLFGANNPGLWGAENAVTINHYAASSCSPCWGTVHDCDRRCFREIDYRQVSEDVKKLAECGKNG